MIMSDGKMVFGKIGTFWLHVKVNEERVVSGMDGFFGISIIHHTAVEEQIYFSAYTMNFLDI